MNDLEDATESLRRIAAALDWYVEDSASDRRARFALAIFAPVLAFRIGDVHTAAQFSVEAADALLSALAKTPVAPQSTETKEPK